MPIIEKSVAAVTLGLTSIAAIPFMGAEVIGLPMLIPSTNSISHLESIADETWDQEGYDVIGIVDEQATAGGIFNTYDFHTGGGRLIVELRDQETGETKYGSMSYYTNGLLGTHVHDELSPELAEKYEAKKLSESANMTTQNTSKPSNLTL